MNPERTDTDSIAVAARANRWRHRMRLGAVGAGIAAAAFIGINLTGSSGSSGGPAVASAATIKKPVASAAHIKKHVIATLQDTSGSIQEVDMVVSRTYSDHPSSTYEYHVWSELGGAENNRIVQKYSDGPTSEDEAGQGFTETYDSSNNTIYRLNDTGPSSGFIAGIAEPIMQQMQNPGAVVDTSATLNGKPAIRITSGNTVTFVAPGTFQPLQTTTSTVGTLQDGQQVTSSGTETFPVWRTLTGSAASPALVSLSAQHPSASTKVVDQKTFNEIDRRMHPHG
jgi:hypothetical protein